MNAAYKRYLASPHWREVKRRYRASKLPQVCHVCGEAKVDLHHKTYKRKGAERLTDLVPLCRTCHSHAHNLLRTRPSKKMNLWTVAKRMRRFYLKHGHRMPLKARGVR